MQNIKQELEVKVRGFGYPLRKWYCFQRIEYVLVEVEKSKAKTKRRKANKQARKSRKLNNK